MSAGLCCTALSGVYGWQGTNPQGGKTALPEWKDIALNRRRIYLAFDSDAASKPSVAGAFECLGNYLGWRGEHDVRFCYYLPALCGLTRNLPRKVHRAAPVTVTLDLPRLADSFEHVF